MRVWSGAESEVRECSDIETGDSASSRPADGGKSESVMRDERSSAEWRRTASLKISGSGAWSDVAADAERGGILLGGAGVSAGAGLLLERRNSCKPLRRRLLSSFFFSLVGIMNDTAPAAVLGRVVAAATAGAAPDELRDAAGSVSDVSRSVSGVCGRVSARVSVCGRVSARVSVADAGWWPGTEGDMQLGDGT